MSRTYLPEYLLFDAICLTMYLIDTTIPKTFAAYDTLSLTKYRYRIWDDVNKQIMDDITAFVTTSSATPITTPPTSLMIPKRVQNIVYIIRYFELLEPLLQDMQQTDEIYTTAIDHTITTDLNRYHVFIDTLLGQYMINYYEYRSSAFYTCAQFRLSLIPIFDHLDDKATDSLLTFCKSVYDANKVIDATIGSNCGAPMSKRAQERLRKQKAISQEKN